jgi:Icc-related predicted phosphoesterase
MLTTIILSSLIAVAASLSSTHTVPRDTSLYNPKPHTTAGNQPSQGHLSLSDNGMTVMWVSGNSTAGDVIYGTDASHLNLRTKPATASTYKASDMCGAPANNSATFESPGTIWTAEIDLSDGKIPLSSEIYYQFGNQVSRSDVFTFHYGPKETNGTTTFIAYGDMGTQHDNDRNSTAEILGHIANVDFVLHVGDISYAVGDSKKWNAWFEEIAPIATKVPYHVCVGNHEYDWPTQHYKPWDWSYRKDSGGECGIPFDRRFKMPGPKLRSEGYLTGSTNIYHSRNVGTVHFVLISSEHDTSKGSEQYTWLEQDLKSVDRTKTPWVVFGQHRPYYGNTVARFLPENKQMRKQLEPLMIQYKVDLVLFGHIHQYQRTCRMVEYKCDVTGPVYNVVGTAGASHQVPFLPKPKWMKVQSDLFGVSKFTAHNESHMQVVWYLDINGTVGDEYWITRE